MPDPNKFKDKDSFMKVCIPMVQREGTAKSVDQAVAICHSMWRRKNLTCNKCGITLILNNNWSQASKDRFDYRCDNCKNQARKDYDQSVKGRYLIYYRNAKKRELNFLLSLFDFISLITKPCAYCGETNLYNGVDRVDNTKGYTLDNCVPCCTVCNRMKRCMTVAEFKKHCKKVVNYGK